MTKEQAITIVSEMNDLLENSGAISIVRHDYIELWTTMYEKTYKVIMYPTTYKAKFETANTSQKFGFARLSVKSQLIAPFPSSYEEFNTKFESDLVTDTEMSNYLKK